MPSTRAIIVLAFLVRCGFFLFGLYQDATMEVKYTDIDYYVFTDAARYVHNGVSPYARETYRYTPLLAWLLVPTSYVSDNSVLNVIYFSLGKFVFILSDLVAGIIILKILNATSTNTRTNLILASIWLFNPMVITISTRGSSESLLAVFVMLFVYLLLKRQYLLSGLFYGFAVHLKIYPIVYLLPVLFHITGQNLKLPCKFAKSLLSLPVVVFGVSSAATFLGLGLWMYSVYGHEFIHNTYLYHFIRTDHRHNFSIYNISLYFQSALSTASSLSFDFTKFAFLPQLLISAVFLPLASTDLLSTMFVQTFAFVNYNKVVTSQYFIWYLLLLPFYLRSSKLIGTWKLRGIQCLILWILSQALWLMNAYNLEFLGKSTFYPQLFFSAGFFFLSNVYILGVFIDDLKS